MKINSVNPQLNNKYINKANTQAFGGCYDRFTDSLAKGIGKVIDTDVVQNFSNKFHKTNLATHIFSATGILLSSFFILSTANSKKIEEERKKPLMLNTAISCAIATVGGYTIDKMLDKPLDKFTRGFKKANIKNPNLHKYLEGMKIAKSALVFGMLYRFVVPVISMFLAEKVIEKKDNKISKVA